MRRCAFNQGGSISKWLISRRSHTKGPLVLCEAAPEIRTRLENAQDGAVEKTAEGQQALLENENGVIDNRKSPAPRPLPLSPLMDPAYLAAKQRHRLPKAASSKEPTPFQQQLAKNPYAQALATPIRMCSLTRTKLPSFFFQDFELIAHPSTNEPWYLPRSLTSAHSHPPASTDDNPSPESARSLGVRRGPRSYVLCRSSLIRAMRTPGSRFANGETRFASHQAKQFPAFRAIQPRWRSDMDTFVLGLMRRRVVEGLKYLCGRRVGYLHGCPDWDYARASKQVGAFLWLGRRNREQVVAADEVASSADGQEEGTTVYTGDAMAAGQEEETLVGKDVEEAVQERGSDMAPGEFATLDMDKERKSKVPVHNLQVLLGDALVEDLRRHVPSIFECEVVALKHRRTTINVQLRLWKLQGYLAEHRQADEE